MNNFLAEAVIMIQTRDFDHILYSLTIGVFKPVMLSLMMCFDTIFAGLFENSCNYIIVQEHTQTLLFAAFIEIPL